MYYDIVGGSDESLPREAGIKKCLGANQIYATLFDHGGSLGMCAEWGDLKHAVRVPTTGRDRGGRYAVATDVEAAVEQLREWREARR